MTKIFLLSFLSSTLFLFSFCELKPQSGTETKAQLTTTPNTNKTNVKPKSADIQDEQTEGHVCLGKTKKNQRCSRNISEEYYKINGAYCWQHQNQKGDK
jgi:hypothetical protein